MDFGQGLTFAVVLIIGLVAISVVESGQYVKRRIKVLEEQNQIHGTSFPTTQKGFDTHLLGWRPLAMAFDPAKRKICILRKNKPQVVDFNFIRNWQVRWTAETKLQSGSTRDTNIRIEFGVMDVNEPILTIGFDDRKTAEKWDKRLDIFFDSR